MVPAIARPLIWSIAKQFERRGRISFYDTKVAKSNEIKLTRFKDFSKVNKITSVVSSNLFIWRENFWICRKSCWGMNDAIAKTQSQWPSIFIHSNDQGDQRISVKTHPETNHLHLTIHKIEKGDEGSWACAAVGRKGKDTVTTVEHHLTIKGKNRREPKRPLPLRNEKWGGFFFFFFIHCGKAGEIPGIILRGGGGMPSQRIINTKGR